MTEPPGPVPSRGSAPRGSSEQAWFAEHAWLPDGPATDVLLRARDSRFVEVTADARPGTAERLPGMVLPGLADTHGHAFHRALRGRTALGTGSFWTWRDLAYQVAGRLDPDTYLALARATYAELALGGVTCVGEFHYLHHAPDGTPYSPPDLMAAVLGQAAADAGVRLTLLDTCYLAGGLTGRGHTEVQGVQRRFADADVGTWAARFTSHAPADGVRVGAAVHSVRAVPREALATVAAAAVGRPLHVHLSEQPAENDACAGYYGCSPTRLLHDSGVLGATTTAVHATHLDGADVDLLGSTRTGVCLCPTTERDLADGLGHARALHDAGSPLSLGTDQHVTADLFEELRALEMHERLRSGVRGRFTPAQLLLAATAHDRLGWDDAGRLAVGARADLVAVGLTTVRTAGCDPAQLPLVATAADVDTVVVEGRTVVAAGQHVLGDVAGLLQRAITELLEDR